MLDELRRRFESEVEKVGVSRIASTLSISRGTVYNWIASGNAPLDKLVALQGLGMDVVYILTGERSVATLAADEAALLDNYRHSPPDAKSALKATSDAFAQSAKGKKRA